jgi:Fe-Mn family superoxide dismutase
MRYHLSPIPCRPWLLNSLSLKLVESHYENNYGGALRRLNAITEQLEKLDYTKTPGHVINGLKREELVALNSTLLHELYFASLNGEGKLTEAMKGILSRDFGSYDRWRDEFVAMGQALGGGSGWVLLTYIPRDGRLINQYASEHSQAVAGGVPILALDMYEHAYHMDFGANAKAYVETFMRNIDWNAVHERHEEAAKISPPKRLEQPEFGDYPRMPVEELRSMMEKGEPVQVVDARPRHSVERRGEMMVGAQWRDHEKVPEWMGELRKDEPVAVFCAYGFHVAARTALALRDAGFDAKVVPGGHSAWKAVGGPTKTEG